MFINALAQDDYVPWDGLQHFGNLMLMVMQVLVAVAALVVILVGTVVQTFSIGASIWQVSGVGTNIKLTQVLQISLETNDKVYIEKGNTYKGTEWYYDGYNWNEAQKTKSTIV